MLNITLRTLIVYVFIIAAVRLSGKRQIGELQPSELVTTILISNLASLPIVLIVSLEILMSYAEIRSRKFSGIVSGNMKTVIRNGVIDQAALYSLRYGIDDLLEALRTKDIYDLNEVNYAVVETNGALNVCKKQAKQTLINEDFLPDAETDRPTMSLVIDGEVQSEAMELCCVNEAWLHKQLEARALELADILLLQYSADEQITVIRRSTK